MVDQEPIYDYIELGDFDNIVKPIYRASGRKIPDYILNTLPEKQRNRILRNRSSAIKSKNKNKNIINNLKKENALLKADNTLKKNQIAVLSKIINDNKKLNKV